VGSSFEHIYEETLDLLRQLGLLACADGRDSAHRRPGASESLQPASIVARERLEFLRDLTRDFVESYFVAADALAELESGGLERKDLTKRALARGQAAYLAGKIGAPESLSRPNFENAWVLLRERGLIDGDEKRLRLQGDRAAGVEFRDQIARYL
jgi:glycerol-3-phosphate O-acyltransferase